MLWDNLERRDNNAEELRPEISHQSDHYNNLWLLHGTSMEEAQKLRSEIMALRSGIHVDSARGWLGGKNWNPEGPSSRPGGSVRQARRLTDHVESSDSWHKRSQKWSTDRGSGRRRE